MRTVIYAINLSIDGCCDHTKFNPSEDMMAFFIDLFGQVDLIVYGRTTYELMIPYWPDVEKDPTSSKSDVEFAKTFNAIDKVVFSRSLDKAAENTKILHGNLETEVLKLKQGTGKNISVGGVSLPEQLMALGLIDEFYFVVHPVVVGKGRRLLDGTDLKKNLNLTLVDSKTFPSGCVALHYVKQ